MQQPTENMGLNSMGDSAADIHATLPWLAGDLPTARPGMAIVCHRQEEWL